MLYRFTIYCFGQHLYAQLIQQPDRQADGKEGKRIAGRSQHCRKNKQDKHRMSAILTKERPCDQSELRKDCKNGRELEQDAHEQHHGREYGDIRIQ